MSFLRYKNEVLNELAHPDGINEEAAQKIINKILKMDKNAEDYDFHIQLGFEIALKMKKRTKILIALWERGSFQIRKAIFEILRDEKYDSKELMASFEVIKFRLGYCIDKERLKALLTQINAKLRNKIVKILEFYGFYTKEFVYRPQKERVWNYWDLCHESVYEIDDVFLKEVEPSNSTKKVKIVSDINEITIKVLDSIGNIREMVYFHTADEPESIEMIKRGKYAELVADSKCRYNTESYAYFCLGDYHNTRKVLLSGLKHAENDEQYSDYVDKLLLLDRVAHISGVHPNILVKFNNDWHRNRTERQIRFRDCHNKYRDFKNFITMRFNDFRARMVDFNEYVYLFYCKDGRLTIYDCKNNVKTRTSVEISDKILQLRTLLNRSKETVARKVTSPESIRKWWIDRYNIDNDLEKLVSFKLNYKFEGEITICLDEDLTEFPFERTCELRKCNVFRLSCSEYVFRDQKHLVLKKLTISCIAGGINLRKTEQRISKFTEKHGIDSIVSENTEIFAFFGHGSGIKHIQMYTPSVMLLFGCSSVRLIERQNFQKVGVPVKYLNTSQIILGCLWDVTDYDIDMFGTCLIELISNGETIHKAIDKAKLRMRLKWLNGASIVVYGRLSAK
ncbi:Regulator of spindle pole body duplication [Trachipleistophora hominis]|uniref:separase n=1 Tax=Trachipleistophora hominis TaxID=72359 RepID=L7JX74_TRAHO|nr:Regulator of spindle pole body duplication [Trachipleistophora hominis]